MQVFESVPATSDAVPIVGKVFMSVLFICGVTLVMTCIILIVSFKTGTSVKELPCWVRFINKYMACVLLIDGEQKRVWRWIQKKLLSFKNERLNPNSPANKEMNGWVDHGRRRSSSLATPIEFGRGRSSSFQITPKKSFNVGEELLLMKKISVVSKGGLAGVNEGEDEGVAFLREKYEQELREKECAYEYDKCVRVLDRFSLVLVLLVYFCTVQMLLSQPEQFWVP